MYPGRIRSRPSENQEYPMKAWKVLLGGAAIICIGAAIAAYSIHTGPVAAAAPAGPPALPVPVAAVVKRTIPVYLEYSARTESIPHVSLQANVAGHIPPHPGTRGYARRGIGLHPQRAGAARPPLRDLQSQRTGPRRHPDGPQRPQGGGQGFASRRRFGGLLG